MAQITCRNVSLGYDGKTVVEGLNFSVNAGDYLCIVGENGAGKSTLIKGLLKLKQPLNGTIETGDLLKPNEIGYLPQQTETQRDFPASVFEVVLSGKLNALGLKPFYTSKERREALEVMSRMGIEKIRHKCYQELSGGQQQRVLLARALCATKKMMLLDEPVAGLDPIMTTEMYRLIESINQDSGITVITVSHDVNNAVDYASHVLHLSRRQLFFGRAEEYRASEIGKRYLGGGQA